MNLERATSLLRHVRLELARDHDFPDGSSERGYELVAPLDDEGRLLAAAWKVIPDRCRVRRFWPRERDDVGHIVHKPGGAWAFHYDIHGDPAHDETGWHLDTHKFVPGEYVSIKEQDGVLRTFRVRAVAELT
ncbi:unnamed protein product [Phaeothamnion confervicola]